MYFESVHYELVDFSRQTQNSLVRRLAGLIVLHQTGRAARAARGFGAVKSIVRSYALDGGPDRLIQNDAAFVSDWRVNWLYRSDAVFGCQSLSKRQEEKSSATDKLHCDHP